MKQVVVIGAGLVGAAMSADLSSDYQVISIDRDESHLVAAGCFDSVLSDLAARGVQMNRIQV